MPRPGTIQLILILAALLCWTGCDSTPPAHVPRAKVPPAAPSSTVATVNGQIIARSTLDAALLPSYGRRVLDDIIMLEVVRQHARQQGIANDEDMRRQTLQRVLDDMAPGKPHAEQHAMLTYMLESRGMARAHFDLILEKRTLLYALVERNLVIDPDALQAEYQRQYGPRATVRLLARSSLRDIRSVQERLSSGADFAALVDSLSEDQRSLGQGGMLPAFSPGDTDIPQAIRDKAFALNTGSTSDPIRYRDQADREWWAIIRVEDIQPAQSVSFATVESSLRESARQRLLAQESRKLENQLRSQATITILDRRLQPAGQL